MIDPVEKIGEKRVTRILQKKQLLMLKELKKILDSNGIEFYLACGSALGCVRHQGFIPWDDDVDIYIRGRDYLKLREVFENTVDTNLSFHDYKTVENYPYTFPKITAKDSVLVEKSLQDSSYQCGVYIDVFPIFGISDNSLKRFLSEKHRYFLYSLIRAYYNNTFSRGYRAVIKKATRRFFSPSNIQKKLEKIYINDKDNTHYLIDSGVFGKQALLSSESFNEIVYLSFESEFMPVPKGYDLYLKSYYGNYMKLPEEKNRISQHGIARLEIDGEKELDESQ